MANTYDKRAMERVSSGSHVSTQQETLCSSREIRKTAAQRGGFSKSEKAVGREEAKEKLVKGNRACS